MILTIRRCFRCDSVSLCYFFMRVFNFSMFLCNIILVLILFWMIWPIRRCLGVGDLYSSWDSVDSWVEPQCPLITPTLCVYTYTLCTYVYIRIRIARCGLRGADDVWRPRHPQTQGYPGYQPKATQLEPRLEHM